jgi:hypothetical protein
MFGQNATRCGQRAAVRTASSTAQGLDAISGLTVVHRDRHEDEVPRSAGTL